MAPPAPTPSASVPEYDLVIRGGTVVTVDGRNHVDIGIQGATIAQLGGPMRGRREIDAADRLILPGGVDPHVHLTCADATEGEPTWADDFESGSAAALAGGITSLGNMSFVLPSESIANRLKVEGDEARRKAIADVFLHPGLLSPTAGILDEIPGLPAQGVTSLKFFMHFPSFDGFAGQFLMAMRSAGQAGSITLVHCEDLATIECCSALICASAQHTIRDFPDTRPIVAEVTATQRAIAMCEVSGAPTYIVHLSSARALAACTEARARGLPVYVETRPLYLHLTRACYDREDGPLFVAQPPLREELDREALWQGLADGSIDTIGSDHAPWTRELKMDSQLDLMNMRPGVSDLETMLPLLFSEGVLKGRLTLERFVAVTATNAAKLFGLYPRKGTIAVGSDADLVIWEAHAPRFVGANGTISRAGHTVYEDNVVRSSPKTTIRRGEIVFDDGKVLGRAGSGQILDRGPTQKL
jgi:dihydropyrimidinase